jgi:hypothetical protein
MNQKLAAKQAENGTSGTKSAQHAPPSQSP